MPASPAAATAFSDTGGVDPTVVLVHGLGLDRQMWDAQVPELRSRYRVVTYDLLGHGGTPRAPQRHDLAAFSRQLVELMNQLGLGHAAVLGFSLGGMIARRFAMDHPDRLWALGILHSSHRRDAAGDAAIRARADVTRREGPGATVEAALSRWLSDAFRRDHPAAVDAVRRTVLSNPRDVYAENYQVLVDGVDELVSPARAIDCPTLVMTGDEDFGNGPAMAQAIAAEIPRARAVILPGLRHLAMIEDPSTVNASLLAFLDDVQAGAWR